jgi:uncharacterized protein (TIGR03437 family)
MKHLFLLALISSIGAQADNFLTGQAARAVIGQVTFTEEDVRVPTNQFVLGAVSGLAYANNELFVVDSNHIQATPVQNRVLIYHNLSGLIPGPTDEIPQGTRCPICVGNTGHGSASVVVGQPDFRTTDFNLTQSGFSSPTGVASDGHILAVTDTDNNRVLIWKTIPATNGVPADIVLGQPDFTSGKPGLSSSALRGPEGVWIQGTRLFVADTANHRVMVWNSIPTSNNQAADYVLGAPDFKTAPPVTTLDLAPTATNMFAPVSVTSDGERLFVADLGHARILIWNSIPTQTQQPADIAIGQPDLTTEVPLSEIALGLSDNNAPALCTSNGKDVNGNPTYPTRCYATLSLPRYALSDGKHLFIADGGNDRVLIFQNMPTHSGQKADIVLGQSNEFDDVVSDSTNAFDPNANVLHSSPGTIRTPLALAWDGLNLYVSDPFDRRVLVFTPGLAAVPVTGITNSASRTVAAIGSITFGGTITAKDTIAVTVNANTYTYTVLGSDTLASIIQGVANLINGTANGKPDPAVVAIPNPSVAAILLSSKIAGVHGNNTAYSVVVTAASTTTTATETAHAAGATLSGGQNAAFVAPGTLVTIVGTFLSEHIVTGVPNADGLYPTKLGGVQVYFDGIAAPLLYVSPNQINAQLPFEIADSNGVTAFVRTERASGDTTGTTSVAVPVVASSPGIFALNGPDPRPAIAYHASSNAIGVVSVDGSIQAGDVATLGIEDRNYSYTIQSTDSLATVRDALITLINDNSDEKVTASAAGEFTRIVITAKVPGPAGDGIALSGNSSTGSLILITPLSAQKTCCANVAGARITTDNPAVGGEVITIYAAGLGNVAGPGGTSVETTGKIYNGPVNNSPLVPVDNAQVGGFTANILSSGLVPGLLGVYKVDIQLDPNVPTNSLSQMFIAQSVFTSNIVTIPIVAAAPAQ